MSKVSQRPLAPRLFLPAALIVGAALLAYAPVLRAGFIWDDAVFLTENRLIRASDGLYQFWFTTAPPDYFPLTSSMLWFEWRLWGQNALGYHVVNVLLHAASAMLLWRVLLRLKVPGAWLAGLLFAVHPVAVESVAWITERKNTLPMVLCLASLLAYLRFDDSIHHDDTTSTTNGNLLHSHHDDTTGTTNGNLQSTIRTPQYSISLGLFLLALLAKTSVVMLPVVLLLLAWWRRGKIRRQDLLRTAPFFALSLALGLVTVWFQWHSGIGHNVARPEGAASHVAAAGFIAWFYLCKILLPFKLCAIYPRWEVDGSNALSFLPILLLAAATVLLWSRRRRWGAGPLVAWACFVISLLPVLGFVDMAFMRLSRVADHLQYAAMPAILAPAAAILALAAARPLAGRLAAVVVGIGLAALAALTFQRAGVFSSEQRLWSDNIEKTPRSAVVWCYLGAAHLKTGALDEAIRCFDQSLELDPKSAETWSDRGAAYARAEHTEEAVRDFTQAIALKPDYAKAWYNRGSAYARTGRLEEALRDLDQAIALKPDYAEAYVNRGNVFMAARRYDEAIGDYGQAIACSPHFADAWYNRANACLAAGRPAEAIRDLDRLVALRPREARAYYKRAIARASLKQDNEALADLERARQLGATVPEDLLRSPGPATQPTR